MNNEDINNILNLLDVVEDDLKSNNENISAILNYEGLKSLQNLYNLYKNLKEKYKTLSKEAQATAFDDQNESTETLLRVLLKQGEITKDEKGYYKRQDFDWEENLFQLGLMKKREKEFYIPDDECLNEYTKQLEGQLKEYNELKEMFKKYYVRDVETPYDACCKMENEIENLKEENKQLKAKIKEKIRKGE